MIIERFDDAIVTQHLREVDLPHIGRAIVVDSDIPDAAPAEIREGLARRAIINDGQPCPCGARIEMPDRAARRRAFRAGRGLSIKVAHASTCPADDELLTALVLAWGGEPS